MLSEESDVLDCIKSDILSADLKFSLFNAALNSYRYNSVLDPFPSVFIESEAKEDGIIELVIMRKIASKAPSLETLKKYQTSANWKSNPELCSLLKWLYLSSNFPKLRRLNNSDVSLTIIRFLKIQKLVKQEGDSKAPSHVFEIIYNSENEDLFQSRRAGQKILYGYHGSRIENFHSILHCGLKSHLNKTSVYGTGTYLSSELSVSLVFSPTGTTWNNSIFGSKLSCIAVCEIIDDPQVKCHEKSKGERTTTRAADSESGSIPEKYYLVPNNDLLRVKYLLVYATQPKPREKVQKNWFRENGFFVVIIAYVVLLLMASVSSSIFKS
ncbi:Mono [ADP-ribose] polymerase PARP16 [Nymphon striatum]|nr:Mono [ADP-ribose] polymerase PARP16 [Nymphon striatum]